MMHKASHTHLAGPCMPEVALEVELRYEQCRSVVTVGRDMEFAILIVHAKKGSKIREINPGKKDEGHFYEKKMLQVGDERACPLSGNTTVLFWMV